MGFNSLIARKYSLTKLLFILITWFFCLFAFEKPWHGGPPITISIPPTCPLRVEKS